jgi:ATP synthase I chain
MTEDSNPLQEPSNSREVPPSDPDSEQFYTRAYTRMVRCMLIAAVLAAPIFFWRPGWKFASGFLLGATLSLLNFRWLERIVYGLSELLIKSPNAQPSGRVVRRFLFRYLLIAVGAYVIFKSSVIAVYGFFAGLSLPVVGVFCEAVYELFTTLRSRSQS